MRGQVKYNELMTVGEYKEAMEYADAEADKASVISDEWLELASKAHLKLTAERLQKNATPNAVGVAGDFFPAASWCKGPHPEGHACSECIDTMESHIAMKGAGLL